ncbi:MAG: ACP S-malonyltransferase [Salinisphaera sp.]|nr:ACP S-malonyltransferase [Salinisphaera sp.]
MLFPGQGSQSLGMLSALAADHAQVDDSFGQASEVLGYDLGALVREGPIEQLNRTEYTQPALLAAGIAVWRIWQSRGGAQPVALAGHSLGEYTALVAAGALAFEDGLRLTRLRGQFMQAAVAAGEGAMAALMGLDDDAVAQVCEQASEGATVTPANYNAPGQVVIAGEIDAVERAMDLAKQAGAKMAKRLAVSVPSHCSLMGPAAQRLQAELSQVPLQTPQIPVRHNVDATARDDAEAIRKALTDQLQRPVWWARTIQALHDDGVETMLECGPGKVLTGLCKRIDKRIQAIALQDEKGLVAGLAI